MWAAWVARAALELGMASLRLVRSLGPRGQLARRVQAVWVLVGGGEVLVLGGTVSVRALVVVSAMPGRGTWPVLVDALSAVRGVVVGPPLVLHKASLVQWAIRLGWLQRSGLLVPFGAVVVMAACMLFLVLVVGLVLLRGLAALLLVAIEAFAVRSLAPVLL